MRVRFPVEIDVQGPLNDDLDALWRRRIFNALECYEGAEFGSISVGHGVVVEDDAIGYLEGVEWQEIPNPCDCELDDEELEVLRDVQAYTFDEIPRCRLAEGHGTTRRFVAKVRVPVRFGDPDVPPHPRESTFGFIRRTAGEIGGYPVAEPTPTPSIGAKVYLNERGEAYTK